MNTNVPFEQWEAEQMQDPEFRAAVEASEAEYQEMRLHYEEELYLPPMPISKQYVIMKVTIGGKGVLKNDTSLLEHAGEG